jgi:hypothetical protein
MKTKGVSGEEEECQGTGGGCGEGTYEPERDVYRNWTVHGGRNEKTGHTKGGGQPCQARNNGPCSTMPLDCGWNAVVAMWETCCKAVSCDHREEVNWVPRTEAKSAYPCRTKSLCTGCGSGCDEWHCLRPAYGSVNNGENVCEICVGGSGPTRSM